MTTSAADPTYRRELDGGLVVRWSTAADGDQLERLYGEVFRDAADDPFNQRLVAWLRDLKSDRHPLASAGDFALVEETGGARRIVAATLLMRQTWKYQGIALPVGRPEIVATAADFRQRGLIRAIFDLIHARSDGRGDLAQGITGIRYFYRRLEYEYALELGGGRPVPLGTIEAARADQPESHRLRPAELTDLPLLVELYKQECRNWMLVAPIDTDYWRWVIAGQNPTSDSNWQAQIIETAEGTAVGTLLTRRVADNDAFIIDSLSLKAGESLLAALPALLRAFKVQAAMLPPYYPGQPPKPVKRLFFRLGREHPVYQALGERQAPQLVRPYAWYIRVPDLPALLRRIAPVLEERLANSVASGYSDQLKLSFYRGGVRLVFAQGRLAAIEPWQEVEWQDQAQAGFPPLVFWQLLFGHRSLSELSDTYPDVWASPAATPILEALFPKRLSWVLPLD